MVLEGPRTRLARFYAIVVAFLLRCIGRLKSFAYGNHIMSAPEIPEATWERRKADFYLELGKTIAAWSYLESGLATWFQRLTQMNEVTARRVFYSIGGFDGRKRALMAVVGWVKTQPIDITPYLNKIIGRAGNYSGSRNFVVHGDVIEVGFAGSKYYGQVILLQGRQPWVADPPDEEVMTIDKLALARENFATLAGCVATLHIAK